MYIFLITAGKILEGQFDDSEMFDTHSLIYNHLVRCLFLMTVAQL